jgi:hypothetical protein
MECAPTNLSILAFANGFTLWCCKAQSVLEAAVPGFFDGVSDLLATGDLVLVSAPDGARALWTACEAGHVQVAPLA